MCVCVCVCVLGDFSACVTHVLYSALSPVVVRLGLLLHHREITVINL